MLLFAQFTFYILITISEFTTNLTSRSIIEFVRMLAGLLSVSTLVFFLYNNGLANRALFGIITFLLISLYGEAMHFSLETPTSPLLYWDLSLVILGIIIICSKKNEIISKKLLNWLIYYILGGLFINIYSGGVEFTFPPKFKFDYFEQQLDLSLSYTHGLTDMFSLGAVLSVSQLKNSQQKKETFLFITLTLVFIIFALAGGSRGEFIACIIVIIFQLLYKKGPVILGGYIIVSIVIFLFLDEWIQQFEFIKRIDVFSEGNYGLRDQLISQSVSLLDNDTRCLIFGCGFGYFQLFYSYVYELYPHNYLIEMVIVFGLPITLMLLVTASIGAFKHYKMYAKRDYVYPIFFYFFITSLKSSSLVDNWMLNIFIIFFIVIGVFGIKSQRLNSHNVL